jgi:orotate phosphoribosyltransferase
MNTTKTDESTALKSRLIEVVKKYGVKFAPPGEKFKLASGGESDFYIDCRKVTLMPDGLDAIIAMIFERLVISDISFDAVGGPTLGADPMVGGLMLDFSQIIGYRDKRGFLVRKEQKGHGLKNLVEGNLKAGDKVIIVEDVATSGGSILHAIAAVEDTGASVVKIFVILDRLAGAAENFAAKGYDFESLITIRDLGLDQSNGPGNK